MYEKYSYARPYAYPIARVAKTEAVTKAGTEKAY
jgi:hypothetical protein